MQGCHLSKSSFFVLPLRALGVHHAATKQQTMPDAIRESLGEVFDRI